MIKTKELHSKNMAVDDLINQFISFHSIPDKYIIDIKYLGEKALIVYRDGYE